MTEAGPIDELLERIAALRAAIAAERAAVRSVGEARLAELAAERQALDAAWQHAFAAFCADASGVDGETWARAQLAADLAALHAVEAERERTLEAHAAELQALARLLSEPDAAGGDVVALPRPQD